MWTGPPPLPLLKNGSQQSGGTVQAPSDWKTVAEATEEIHGWLESSHGLRLN